MNLPLLDALKIALENTVCEEHHVKAVVEIKEEDDTVNINCCCGQFHNKCSDLVTELLEVLEFKEWTVEHSHLK